MTDKRNIYLSCPYSLIKNKAVLMHQLSQIRFRLEKMGYVVFSPLHHTYLYEQYIPKQTHEFWMEQNIAFIECMMNNDGKAAYTKFTCPVHDDVKEDTHHFDIKTLKCNLWNVERQAFDCNETIFPEDIPIKYDSGVIMLLPKIAYIPLDECEICGNLSFHLSHISEWKSKGCFEEYNICKSKFIQIFDLDAFLEGKEEEL